ncbi:ACP S-malonyltransferase [Paenibacillus ottowii]|nr:ACP S-malonyltransferase [Paenibacillus ottowii]MDP1513406.1 ACP S-malonyltransferase [Paenibacillus ottowii]
MISEFSAGHSLGEYSALVSSSILSFGDALRLVQERGRFMEEAAMAKLGSMIAIRGAMLGEVEECCRLYSTVDQPAAIACYNSPSQYVVSGHHTSVALAAGELEQRGAQITRLQVSGLFHSPLMQPAADRLAAELQKYTLNEPKWPVISNVIAQPYRDVDSIRQGLILQMTHPVRWIQTVQYMMNHGVKQGIQLGPRTVLKNLTREISPNIEVLSLDRNWDRLELDRRFSIRDWIACSLSQQCLPPTPIGIKMSIEKVLFYLCADWKIYCETWNQAAVRFLLLSKDRKYWSVFALCCKPNRSPKESRKQC